MKVKMKLPDMLAGNDGGAWSGHAHAKLAVFFLNIPHPNLQSLHFSDRYTIFNPPFAPQNITLIIAYNQSRLTHRIPTVR